MRKFLYTFLFCLLSFSVYADEPIDTGILTLGTAKELTISGLLLVAVWFLWSSHKDTKAELQKVRDERDKQMQELNSKLYELSLNQSLGVAEFKRVIEENSKVIQEHGKMLERFFERNR